jgi:hypothetical protein
MGAATGGRHQHGARSRRGGVPLGSGRTLSPPEPDPEPEPRVTQAKSKSPLELALEGLDFDTNKYGMHNLPTPNEVKKHYRRLSLKVHPDKTPDNIMAKDEFQTLTANKELIEQWIDVK